jgi:hypothetical protein
MSLSVYLYQTNIIYIFSYHHRIFIELTINFRISNQKRLEHCLSPLAFLPKLYHTRFISLNIYRYINKGYKGGIIIVNTADVSLNYVNGSIEIQLIIKELSLLQLKKVVVDKYYLLDINLRNNNGVELKAKICIPIQKTDLINQKNNKGNIGNVFYQLNPNGKIFIKTKNRISLKNIKVIGDRYLIDIIDDSKSIINIHYTIPEEKYHKVVPKKLLTPGEAKAQAQNITNQILAGNYPKETKNIKQPNTRKNDNLNPKTLKQPRILVARDTSFKRCEHCINCRTKNYCVVHKKTVQSNNVCSRFFTPKIYLGGSVSPR